MRAGICHIIKRYRKRQLTKGICIGLGTLISHVEITGFQAYYYVPIPFPAPVFTLVYSYLQKDSQGSTIKCLFQFKKACQVTQICAEWEKGNKCSTIKINPLQILIG